MPTYEYRCPQCGSEFEKFQSMSEEPTAPCPECGTNAVRRLSGGAGFLFKGSGFYITDYRGEGYKKAAAADKGSSSGGEAKAEPKGGDSKPAGGSEAPKPSPKAAE